MSYFSYHVGGARARSRDKSKQKYSHKPHTTEIQKISQASHTHQVMITRVSAGGSRRAPRGERRASRRARLVRLEVLVASVVLASQLPRMQRVTCDNSLLAMVHTLSLLPPDERHQGAACEGEGRRTLRRGACLPTPRERLAGRRVAADGGQKKMI